MAGGVERVTRERKASTFNYEKFMIKYFILFQGGKMSSHAFSFKGGDILADIGATWFVSYSYYKNISPCHRNWDLVKTSNMRISKYNNSKEYHILWLKEILNMNDNKLGTNTIDLTATEVKQMANEILIKKL